MNKLKTTGIMKTFITCKFCLNTILVFALIVLFPVKMSADSHDKHYGQLTISSSNSAYGKVYFDTDASKAKNSDTQTWNCGKSENSDTHTFTIGTVPTGDGYYFTEWGTTTNGVWNAAPVTASGSQYKYTTSAALSTNKSSPTPFSLMAKFRYPRVTSVEQASLVGECPAGETRTLSVGFSVTDTEEASDLNIYIYINSGNGGFTRGTPVLNTAKNKITVPITFTPTGVIGEHTVTVTCASYNTADATNSKSATIAINELAEKLDDLPLVASVGFANTILQWNAYAGATKYVIARSGTTITTITDGSLTYIDDTAQPNQDYAYTVQAFIETQAKAEGLVEVHTAQTITTTNAVHYNMVFPYYAKCGSNHRGMTITTHESKTIGDMSYLFAQDGTPYFDKLYFLIDNATAANAACYQYKKDGTKYTLERVFNPRSAYPAAISTAGKYYFTGSCDVAWAGHIKETTREGFVQIEGNGSAQQIDIYVDNLIVTTFSKDGGDTNTVTDQEWIIGGSSVFAIKSPATSLSNTLTTFFHTRGFNTWRGTQGCKYDFGEISVLVKTVNLGTHITTSAAIAVKPTSSNTCAKLKFDDRWVDNTQTNGYLHLIGYDNAPGIDQGNKNTLVEFYSGQYELPATYMHSGGRDIDIMNLKGVGAYTTSLAISYRHYTAMNLASHYGFGEDQADGVVHIYDGTFYSNGGNNNAGTKGVADGIYYAPTDIRLPQGYGSTRDAKSFIDGGNFGNSAHVYFCSDNTALGSMPVNSRNQSLCRVEVSSEGLTIDADGRATDINLTKLKVVSPEDGTITEYDMSSTNYGKESITPDAQNQIFFYLYGHRENEGQVEDIECTKVDDAPAEFWHVALPEVKTQTGLYKIGGDIAVNTLANKKNNYFAYFELEQYAMNHFQFGSGLDFSYARPSDPTAEVTNGKDGDIEEYTFQYQMYIVLPLLSNRWYTMTPPFDISNVYIVEHNISGLTPGTEEYLDEQGSRNAQMAFQMIGDILPYDKSTNPDLIARNVSLLQSLKNYGYSPLPLEAFDGNNGATAHYYLFESAEDGVWTKSNESYSANWQYVSKIENVKRQIFEAGNAKEVTVSVLMQGPKWDNQNKQYIPHVYSMFFPSGITEKYWDGKYIIFEGYGPQTIPDKTAISDMIGATGVAPQAGTVQLGGNYTFAKMKSADLTSCMYVVDENKSSATYNQFIPHTTAGVSRLLPTRAYMAVGSDASDMPFRAIAHDGTIVWDSPTNDKYTQLTTLFDATLVVSVEQNEVHISSAIEQYVGVYTPLGQLLWDGKIATGGTKTLTLPQGIYVVSADGETKKVIVR